MNLFTAVMARYLSRFFTWHFLHSGAISAAGGVAKDQADADDDMSIKQRLVLAGGSAVGGASEIVDNEVIASAMEVAGEQYTTFDMHPSRSSYSYCTCIYLYTN